MKIIAIDISGNFEEGKGTTGYVIGSPDGTIHEVGEIKASDYKTRMEYHDAVISLALNRKKSDVVVCENFKLYQHKAVQQSHSELETPRIIGALEYCCWLEKKPMYFQMAVDVKNRFSDEVLIDMGVLHKEKSGLYFQFIKTNDHERDALRHYFYFIKYGLKKHKIKG